MASVIRLHLSLCAMPTKHRIAKTSIDRVYIPIDIRLEKLLYNSIVFASKTTSEGHEWAMYKGTKPRFYGLYSGVINGHLHPCKTATKGRTGGGLTFTPKRSTTM